MGQIIDERKQKISQLGLAGEKIIRNMLSKQGLIVEDSLDYYDNTKDMTVFVSNKDDEFDENSSTIFVNGKTVEVKTCTPYVEKKAVTIRKNQLKKCRNVDELYFVTVPHKFLRYKYENWILKIDPKTFECESYKQNDKREPLGYRNMLAIKIGQEATTRIRELTENEKNELLKYSVSGE